MVPLACVLYESFLDCNLFIHILESFSSQLVSYIHVGLWCDALRIGMLFSTNRKDAIYGTNSTLILA